MAFSILVKSILPLCGLIVSTEAILASPQSFPVVQPDGMSLSHHPDIVASHFQTNFFTYTYIHVSFHHI